MRLADRKGARTNQFSFVLGLSAIEGIGVFAVHAIAKGAVLHLFPQGFSRYGPDDWIPAPFDKYCVQDGVRTVAGPPHFSGIDVGWYLNHAADPNVCVQGDDEYHALRRIKAGEELTLDYRTLEE